MRVYSYTDSGLTVTLSFLSERPANQYQGERILIMILKKKLSIYAFSLLALPRGLGRVYATYDRSGQSFSCQCHWGRALQHKTDIWDPRRWLDVATPHGTESKKRRSSFRGGSNYQQRPRRFRRWRRWRSHTVQWGRMRRRYLTGPTWIHPRKWTS